MREIKKIIFKDKNNNIIEEGDILIIDTEEREYQISLVHWDWRRIELGVIPFVPINEELIRYNHPLYYKLTRSEWLARFASFDKYEKSCAEILIKHNSQSALTNRYLDPEIIYSGGVPIPKITRKQAEKLGDYYDYFPDSVNGDNYFKRMRALVRKLRKSRSDFSNI